MCLDWNQIGFVKSALTKKKFIGCLTSDSNIYCYYVFVTPQTSSSEVLYKELKEMEDRRELNIQIKVTIQ